MDAFFVSVELKDKPELAHLPVAVGGDSARRGVISTCNYIARQYGVHSAMASALAKKKCPDLVLLPGQMDRYKQISQTIRKIFLQYTDLVEPLSLDEAYLDVSEAKLEQGSATLTAEKIRQQIFVETGLTASAGIAQNKFLAKIASEINKPNGQYTIAPHQAETFIRQLPLKKIPGVGRVTAQKLADKGWYTGGDIQDQPQSVLIERLGRYGGILWQRCQGIDERSVEPSRVRKSVGVETTFSQDIQVDHLGQQQLNDILRQKLIPELVKRYQRHLSSASEAQSRQINRLTVKVKFSDFQQTTKDCRASQIDPNRSTLLLEQALQRSAGRAVRLLGIQLGFAANQNSAKQLDLPFV